MAGKKPSSGPRWQVILEEMRSQNRTTLEAVEAFRASIEDRIERLDRESRDRDDTLARAVAALRREVRQNSTDINELRRLGVEDRADIAELKRLGMEHSVDIRVLNVRVQENTVELRSLSTRVDALNRLEERVSALERRAQ
jgi:hypothetical protein